MAKRFFSFDSPPFKVLAEHLAKDEDFLSDANAILQISDDDLERLATALAGIELFLDRKTLCGIVESTLELSEHASRVAQIVWRLNQLLRDTDEPLEATVGLLKESITKFSEKISKDDRKKLAERLEKLTKDPKGFSRQHKAEKLAEATGVELEDVQIISDIRPVFNEDRSEIEGAVPLTTLRLDTVKLDGMPSSTEVRLTEQQLIDLSEKVKSAEIKVSVIKKVLEAKSITLASTSATIQERVEK